MRTRVYIDGLNLYHGRLKHTAYKWLDVVLLHDEQLVRPVQPTAVVEQVRFYTAPVLRRFSSSGEAERRQVIYHNALKTSHPERFVLIEGRREPQAVNAVINQKPLDLGARHPVWHLEEKESDVRLALDMYRDAIRGDIDQLVLCSNDSDLAPALELARQDCPELKIGLVFPRSPDAGRAESGQLRRHADWIRNYIRDDELAEAQLPRRVVRQGKGFKTKVYDRPPQW